MPPVDANLIIAFKEIASQVTTEDVMETALEMGCHYATVQRYLRGEVKKEICPRCKKPMRPGQARRYGPPMTHWKCPRPRRSR